MPESRCVDVVKNPPKCLLLVASADPGTRLQSALVGGCSLPTSKNQYATWSTHGSFAAMARGVPVASFSGYTSLVD